MELIGCYLEMCCGGLGERCLWAFVDSILQQTALIKMLFLDFLELFLV